jgi:dolichol-phosphate mannosyltransferase
MLKTVDYDSTRAKGYGFQMELAYRVKRAGGKIVEVPIVFTDRVRGHSKLTMSVAAEELTLVTWWGVRDRVIHRSPK